jgi:hypothetical protein
VSDAESSAAEKLAELTQARDRAAARVDELESEQRAATQAAAEASAALADLERRALGGEKVSAAGRREAEDALARARAEAEQPWGERVEGCRAAVRDAHQRVQHFTAEHLDALVQGLEQDGEVAASSLNSAAEALVAAYRERERIAGEIATLVSPVARIHPGDVAFSRAEQVARAASDLIESGGEVPPRLRRDPRQARGGMVPEAEPVTAA